MFKRDDFLRIIVIDLFMIFFFFFVILHYKILQGSIHGKVDLNNSRIELVYNSLL